MTSAIKSVLITGANRGIGLAHAKAFAARGVRVFATARVPAEATELNALTAAHAEHVTVLQYDATVPDAPSQVKSVLGSTPIDLILANAGMMADKEAPFGAIDVEAILQLTRLNALAPLKLVEALADNVASSTRKMVAFQSSLMGSVGDNGSGGYYAYRISKGALNMIAKGVSNDLRSRGVIAVALHPGWVKTRMGGASAPVSVAQCVAGQQSLFEKLTLADSGQFFNYDGKKLPW